MKAMKSVLTLAVLCIIAAPALANGPGCGAFGLGPLMDLSKEEMMNMTLAQLKEYRLEKIQERDNMTLGELKAERDALIAERENMTLGQLMENKDNRGQRNMPHAMGFEGRGPMQGGQGQMGPQDGGWGKMDSQVGARDMGRKDYGMSVSLMNLGKTQDELMSMTVSEIRTLMDEKRAEMENMTLAEIDAMQQDLKSKLENMTLEELDSWHDLQSLIGGWGHKGDGAHEMMGMRPGVGMGPGICDGSMRRSGAL